MKIGRLRCNLLHEPRGIDVISPELSWELTSTGTVRETQVAYRIIVASDVNRAANGEGDFWDSGRVQSSATTFIRYAGKALQSRDRCHWRVTIWDSAGQEFQSLVSSWTMGLLSRKDWRGHWIGLDAAPEFPEPPLSHAKWIWDDSSEVGIVTFEKPFDLEQAGKGILWGLADDEAEVEINGRPICQLPRAQGNFNLFPLPTGIEVDGLLAGRNTIRIKARKRHDRDKWAGVILRLLTGSREIVEGVGVHGVDLIGAIQRRHEGGVEIVTDETWTSLREDQATAVHELGSFGIPPWHLVAPRDYPNLSARYLRREFTASQPVVQAVVYFSGLGLSELWLNGDKVGCEVLSPHATDYAKRVYYRTFDVTEKLHLGGNAIGCILGNGRYFAPRVAIPIPMENYGCPKLLFQLEITYEDGSVEVIASDSQWKITNDGPIGWNNEFDGETYDARKEDPTWSQPGFDDKAWSAPQNVAGPMGHLRAQVSAPIHISEVLPVKDSWKTKYGTTIYDFGVNLVGWSRARLQGAEGQRITLQFAEEIENLDSLALENLRSALCTDTIILRDGITEFEPKFTYHGFRYMEMRGELASAEFEACFVHDEVRQVGTFTCSNPLINDIVTAAARGIRGNYRSMPTDCPQRDERMGWLGDRAGGAPGEMFLFDVSNVYRKWMDDIRESQTINGSVPDIAPPFWKNYSDNVTWPSCVVFIPHWLRRHYGDGGVVELNFDAITRWLDHMCEYLQDGLLDRDIYGDWCVPPEEGYMIHSTRADRKTSPFILASAYLAQNLELASRMAEQLGQTELATRWRSQRTQIADALNARFLDPATGRYDNGSQTAALLPLAFELTPEPQRKQVFDYLVSRIEENGKPALGTGLVGGQWLLRTLTAYGRADIALALVAREEYPSWGYMIRQGATTIWELWNGNSAEPLMNSGNHVMLLGDLVTWLFEDVAGIRPRVAGFEQITLRPHFILDSVDCKHESIRGPIHSSWETKNGQIHWKVSLPPNVETTVELPASVANSLRINQTPPELVPCSVPASPFSWVQTMLPPGTHLLTLDRPT